MGLLVFPSQEGMNPRLNDSLRRGNRVPLARGDESVYMIYTKKYNRVPLARGDESYGFGGRDMILAVFPSQEGMNLTVYGVMTEYLKCSPRKRG